MTKLFLKNTPLLVLIVFYCFGCAEKAYVPYIFFEEPISYATNEIGRVYLDKKTGDVYRSFQNETSAFRRFQLSALLTDEGIKIPFKFESKNSSVWEIKDSMMYFNISDPKGDWDSLKTIKYKITKSGFIPIDSFIQLSLSTPNSYIWKKDCETIFYRLTGNDFQNGIETEIIPLDSLGEKSSFPVFSKTGRFRILQTRCSDSSIVFSKELELELSKDKGAFIGAVVYKLYHVGNRVFIIYSDRSYSNSTYLAWLDLKTGKLKKTPILNYYNSGAPDGFRPVLYDNSKKVVIPRVGKEPTRHEPYYDNDRDCHISCYDTKTGKPEWHIDFKRVLKDSFSSVVFKTRILGVFKLNENEIGVIYQRSHTKEYPFPYTTPSTFLIIDKKGRVRQKISGKLNQIGGVVVHQNDGVIRLVRKDWNQYLLRGKIEKDSKYYWMKYNYDEIYLK